ncbi:hypothetical protein BH11CYA1_BH11CYA1_48990 [soil metagenome]
MTPQTLSITEVAAPSGGNPRALKVGAKVAILQHKHLKCAAHGFVQFINGAYISVRAEDIEVVESDACERTFELYPNELRVVATYQHEQFKPGTVVRIKELSWLNVSPKTHGIVTGVEAERILVQPVGAHKGAIISLRPEALQVESNQGISSPQVVAMQASILAVLAAVGRRSAITQLKRLLATQTGLRNSEEIDRQLAVLANLGQITLSESQVALAKSDEGDGSPSVTLANQDSVEHAIDKLARAEEELAEAVRQAILTVSL